jgi:imidazolonepropionase-like amidohydrolase
VAKLVLTTVAPAAAPASPSAAEALVLSGRVRAMPHRDHEPPDLAFTSPVALHEAGARFCCTAGGPSDLPNLPDEAGMAIGCGLPPEAAPAGITSSPAEVSGVAGEIGRVAAGLRANLVLRDGASGGRRLGKPACCGGRVTAGMPP